MVSPSGGRKESRGRGTGGLLRSNMSSLRVVHVDSPTLEGRRWVNGKQPPQEWSLVNSTLITLGLTGVGRENNSTLRCTLLRLVYRPLMTEWVLGQVFRSYSETLFTRCQGREFSLVPGSLERVPLFSYLCLSKLREVFTWLQ